MFKKIVELIRFDEVCKNRYFGEITDILDFSGGPYGNRTHMGWL
jgi:hypothetical protein